MELVYTEEGAFLLVDAKTNEEITPITKIITPDGETKPTKGDLMWAAPNEDYPTGMIFVTWNYGEQMSIYHVKDCGCKFVQVKIDENAARPDHFDNGGETVFVVMNGTVNGRTMTVHTERWESVRNFREAVDLVESKGAGVAKIVVKVGS